MATRQEDVFLNGEGDNWFKRNSHKWPERITDDPVLEATKDLNPRTVLEIGCGNGWRLEQYRKRGSGCWGIDPSSEAIINGQRLFPGIHLRIGSATRLLPMAIRFDMVVYGFCLYLCDRDDLFDIVCAGDHAVKEGGHLVIHDFLPDHPHSTPYHHAKGVLSYKMDYSRLWLANPAYKLISQIVGIHPFAPNSNDGESVTVLQKNARNAWPLE
jgi:SAM-dependent methyltransferase